MTTLTAQWRRLADLLGPALFCLVLLLAGRVCQAQTAPPITTPPVIPPLVISPAIILPNTPAPTTHDPNRDAVYKAIQGYYSVAVPAASGAPVPTTYEQDFAALCKAVEEHFYDPAFNGLDWPRVRAEYAQRLKAVTTNAQFLALMNDLLLRLHASHTRLYGPDDFEFYLLPEVMNGPAAPRSALLQSPILQSANLQAELLRVEHLQTEHLQVAFQSPGAARRLFQIGCLPASGDPARVAAVLDGSPAAAAGLRAGDVLVSVGGQPYRGLTQFGPAPLRLVYRRQGKEAIVTITPVEKTALDLMLAATERSARIIPLPDGRKIGYVRLWCMGDPRFEKMLASLVLGRLHETDGLVLDLRQGYGGSPVGYADPFFLPDIQVSARNHQQPRWAERHIGYNKPLVVLVDGGTRSAKEWLAWTLQASKRARLVGQRTAGAVLGMQVFPVGSGFQLELAVQDLALNGVHLEGHGVDPDVVLAGSPSDEVYLQQALQMLSKKRAGS